MAEAAAIEIIHFRQILLVPFAIEARGSDGRAISAGAELVEAIEARLGHPWVRVENRWLHLREDRLATGEQLARAYAEFVYFEPYVQRFLFGRQGEVPDAMPIRLWRREDICGVDVEIRNRARAKFQRLRLRVDRLNLYLFDTGNAMLALELAFDPEVAAAVAAHAEVETALQLDTVLSLIERVRRIFPPYFAPFDTAGNPTEGLVAPLFPTALNWVMADPTVADTDFTPSDLFRAVESIAVLEKHACPPVHPRWLELLRPLPVEGDAADDPAARLSQLGDDRAFSFLILGVDDVSRIEERDWVRLAMADEAGDGWPYARDFLADFKKRHAYDRFFDPAASKQLATRYVFSAYAMAQIGTCARPDAPGHDFFRDVLVDHGRRHYFQLALISYFQKATLLTLSERLAEAIAHDSADFGERTHAIQRDVLRFTHRYWFEDISAQIQGQEIFEQLRTHLRTRELYRQVSQEIREADQFLIAEEQGDVARAAGRLNWIAAVGLVLGVATGFFGMNILVPASGGGLPWQRADWALFVTGLLASGAIMASVYFLPKISAGVRRRLIARRRLTGR